MSKIEPFYKIVLEPQYRLSLIMAMKVIDMFKNVKSIFSPGYQIISITIPISRFYDGLYVDWYSTLLAVAYISLLDN